MPRNGSILKKCRKKPSVKNFLRRFKFYYMRNIYKRLLLKKTVKANIIP